MNNNREPRELKIILRLCHRCNKLIESEEEILKCGFCKKSFLPVNYFERKVLKRLKDSDKKQDKANITDLSDYLSEAQIVTIKGLIAVW